MQWMWSNGARDNIVGPMANCMCKLDFPIILQSLIRPCYTVVDNLGGKNEFRYYIDNIMSTDNLVFSATCC